MGQLVLCLKIITGLDSEALIAAFKSSALWMTFQLDILYYLEIEVETLLALKLVGQPVPPLLQDAKTDAINKKAHNFATNFDLLLFMSLY